MTIALDSRALKTFVQLFRKHKNKTRQNSINIHKTRCKQSNDKIKSKKKVNSSIVRVEYAIFAAVR